MCLKPTVRVLLLWLCLPGGLTASEVSQSSASMPEPPKTLSFWKGIAPFGSEKTQPDEQIKQAFREIKAYFHTLDNWRTDIYQPIEDQANWSAFRQAIAENSSSEFFSRAESHDGKIIFSGQWRDADQTNFQFSIDPISNHIKLDQIGEVKGRLSLVPDALDDEQIMTQLNAEVFLDTILFTEALESIEAVNTLFDQPHDTEITAANNAAFDQRLRSEFKQSLPGLMTTLERISTFEKLANIEQSPEGFPVTRITHQQKIDLNALKEHFPDTYRDYKTLLRSVTFTSDILTEDNQRIGRILYDADSRRFNVEFALSQGGFMLQDMHGALLNKVIFPTQLDQLNYHIVTNANLSLFGLSVDIKKLNIEAEYHSGLGQAKTKRDAFIHMQLNTAPDIQVHGALLYFLPTWLIDLLIPGTLETLIMDAYQDMVLGRNGKGITFLFSFKEREHKHWLNLEAHANIAYSLLQGFFKVTKKERSDKPRLYITLRQKLREDFASYADRIVTTRSD